MSPLGAPSTAPVGSWYLRTLCGICVDHAVAVGRTEVACLVSDHGLATCPACLLVSRILRCRPGGVFTVSRDEVDTLKASILGWRDTQPLILQLDETGRCELYGLTIQRV